MRKPTGATKSNYKTAINIPEYICDDAWVATDHQLLVGLNLRASGDLLKINWEIQSNTSYSRANPLSAILSLGPAYTPMTPAQLV